MTAFWKRILCLTAAMLLTVSATNAESEASAMSDPTVNAENSEHFVPENPNMDSTERTITLSLSTAYAAPDQPEMEHTDAGLFLCGNTAKAAVVPLPFRLIPGERLTLTVTGSFRSEKDRGLRFSLSDDKGGSLCSIQTEYPREALGDFTYTATLIANKAAASVLISTPSVFARFNDIVITGMTITADETLLARVDTSVPYHEAVKADWYQPMLRDAQVNLGNNRRLKALIERARAGEKLTVATIGGSITEGAGAKRYEECYAYRIFDGFRKTYGTNGGSNISFVNAGVGGTPSTFGWMRYQRDIVDRVKDDDGLPDLVVIEYAVNDGGEPTAHRCYESMVRQILAQPNQPVVILLFAVFPSAYNLQRDLRPVGDALDLMMVSIKDGPFKQVGVHWTEEGFFFDVYHPTSLGHAVMADCVLAAISDALALPENEQDIDLSVKPAYGTNFTGLQTIYAHSVPAGVTLDRGSFNADDTTSYTNLPVGRVCGKNFAHTQTAGNAPLTFTATFRNLMIAYRTMSDASYGSVDVLIDGKFVRRLKANTGSWGQSVVDLLWDAPDAAEHTVTIRMTEGDEARKFTITCLGYTPD